MNRTQSILALKSNMAVVRSVYCSVWFNFKTLSRLCPVVVQQSMTNKSYFSYDVTHSQLFHRTELILGETGFKMRRTTGVLGSHGSSTRSARTRFLSLSIIHGLKHGGQMKQGKEFRSNQNIKAKEVRLIDQEGKNLGIMALKKALEVGNETKCLVVEVGTSAGSETVCKLISEKQLYDKMKEEKKKNFKTTKTKEIKLTGKICDHDLEIKLKKMREFLEGHNSVKVFVAHRKRQNTSLDDKQAVIDNITKQISDVGSLQAHPKPVGKGLRCIFIPHHRN